MCRVSPPSQDQIRRMGWGETRDVVQVNDLGQMWWQGMKRLSDELSKVDVEAGRSSKKNPNALNATTTINLRFR